MNWWDHFKDQKEFWDRVDLKKADSDLLYPQNLERAPNDGVDKWTNEFYYTYNKGKNNSKSGEIREKFQRGATDAASSLGSAGLEVCGCDSPEILGRCETGHPGIVEAWPATGHCRASSDLGEEKPA